MLKIIIISILLIVRPSFSAPSEKNIEIKFDGEGKPSQKVYIGIFTQKEGFPGDSKKAHKRAIAKFGDKSKSMKIKSDHIAVSAFIDENGNGKLDTNALGIPTEPLAFSGNPSLTVSGPDYDTTVVKLSKKKNQITLKFKTYLE